MVNSHKNKAVVDAVNALQGNFYSARNGGEDGEYLMKVVSNEYCDYVHVGGFVRYTCDVTKGGRDDVMLVCLEEEFNQCVAEMIEGLFVPDCRPKMLEIQYDNKGNGLEVGAAYEFSDDGEAWSASKFYRYESEKRFPFITDLNCGWMYIRECQSPIGKIHKKPIELVDGEAYQFEYIAGKFIGIYGKSDDLFYMSNRRTLNREYAKNIIKLVPESI